jgi:hypothetical protein
MDNNTNNNINNNTNNNENMFIYGCKTNMINFVKYLFNKDKDKLINSTIITNNNELNTIYWGFCIAIYKSNIEIVKWIYSLNIINIDNYRFYCYNLPCKYKIDIILEWFKSIDSKYNYIIVDNKYRANITNTVPYFIRNEKYDKIIKQIKMKIDKTLELEDCIICYEKSNILTKCKHSFCFKCLCDWYIRCEYTKESCPYCRKILKLTYCTYKPN